MLLEQRISANRAYLMGIAILSIMLFHQAWIYGWNPVFAFFHFYGNWGVDIFFLVSGFGLYYSLKKDNRVAHFYYRRIIRILPLCLVCGLFRYIVDHILPVGIGGYPTGEHAISSNWLTILSWDKWFIPVILIYYMVMPLIYKAIDRYGLKVLCFAYFVSLVGVWSDTLNTYSFNIYTLRFPSFCMGVAAAAGLFNESKRVRYVGFVMIINAVIYKFLIMTDCSWVYNDSYTYLLLSMGIIILCLFIIKCLPSISIIENNRLVSFCMSVLHFLGRHTLEIYLVHEFIYRYTYRFLIETTVPLSVQLLIGMTASVIIAILLSISVNYLLRLFRI